MQEVRPGDWLCLSCGGHNYSKRSVCFRCSAPKPVMPGSMVSPMSMQPSIGFDGAVDPYQGQWVCARCRSINAPVRMECFICGEQRFSQWKAGSERKPREKVMREGDWYCGSCDNFNYSFRDTCQKCSAPKSSASRVISAEQIAASGVKSYQTRPGDWNCPSCSAHNYAFRTSCFRCSAEKP
ncbi:putative RNA-binding protein cabeza [Monocercomonoides exilis]|uniref:putative RNA-binding protein cabeza n=1 Tax=Monocercomonoides exilis TaxID=2049356 RepID=UPI00355ACD08|nr:putative RNA-binding protein cabeza [Monocercomonoides exilis]